MTLKRTLLLLASAGLLMLIYGGYSRYCARRSLQEPLPNHWASLDRNFDAVSQDVRRRFPEVTSTGHYDWTNGYAMGFGVRSGTTPAQAKEIVDYAYPHWVMIRRMANMAHASECNVSVWGDNGKLLSPE